MCLLYELRQACCRRFYLGAVDLAHFSLYCDERGNRLQQQVELPDPDDYRFQRESFSSSSCYVHVIINRLLTIAGALQTHRNLKFSTQIAFDILAYPVSKVSAFESIFEGIGQASIAAIAASHCFRRHVSSLRSPPKLKQNLYIYENHRREVSYSGQHPALLCSLPSQSQ